MPYLIQNDSLDNLDEINILSSLADGLKLKIIRAILFSCCFSMVKRYGSTHLQNIYL
jgi:hypothetical protein